RRRPRDRWLAPREHRRRPDRQRRADRRLRAPPGARGRAAAARPGRRTPGAGQPSGRVHAAVRRAGDGGRVDPVALMNIALSDVVYMAESAYLSDPHVTVGLVAADGGPLTWPLHTSLLLAKEYAFTGDRISAQRAAEIGLANHVCPDAEVFPAALATAHKIAALPRQAVEATKRVLNLHVERAVLATIDFALASETESFDTPELRANVDRFLGRAQS